MAVIHRTSLSPTKLELLQQWLPGQDWAGSPEPSAIAVLGSYRFDDPDGEVGVETMLIESGAGRILQVPLTYRSAPEPAAPLIGTAEHGVLGRRWIHDGTADPVYQNMVITTVLTGGREAELVTTAGEHRPGFAQVRGSGEHPHGVGAAPAGKVHREGPTVRLSYGGYEFTLLRLLGSVSAPAGALTLTGTWAEETEPRLLGYLS